jgi:hypothetical protein
VLTVTFKLLKDIACLPMRTVLDLLHAWKHMEKKKDIAWIHTCGASGDWH